MARTERHRGKLEELGIKLVAASADPEIEAAETVDGGLGFPIAFGLTPEDARTLHAWVGERRGVPVVQPCEFVLRPDGTIAASMYASTQLGRMDPEEIERFVSARKDQ